MFKKILHLVLIFICMITIFLFSCDNGDKSTVKSDSIIIKSAQFFLQKDLNSKEREKLLHYLVVPVRKCAHFLIYSMLGFLVLQFLVNFSISSFKAYLLAIFWCFLYACSDEIHQLFVVGRSGQVLDVFIDTLGAIFGCFLYTFISAFIRKVRGYE